MNVALVRLPPVLWLLVALALGGCGLFDGGFSQDAQTSDQFRLEPGTMALLPGMRGTAHVLNGPGVDDLEALDVPTGVGVTLRSNSSSTTSDRGVRMIVTVDEAASPGVYVLRLQASHAGAPADVAFFRLAIPATGGAATGPVSKLAGGREHSVALLSDGSVASWGSDVRGQLGTPEESDQVNYDFVALGRPAVDVAAGRLHALVVLDDGGVWSWGNNDDGQLARPAPDSVPRQVLRRVASTGASSDWVPLSQSRVVGAGDGVSFAATDAAPFRAWGWGSDAYGQLADATSGPGGINDPGIVLTEGGPPQSQVSLEDVAKIAAGRRHTAALCSDGTVWVWGDNQNGQLGVPSAGDAADNATRVLIPDLTFTDVAVGAAFTVLLDEDGLVWTAGHNDKGQLGNDGVENRGWLNWVRNLPPIVQIEAGEAHVLALDEDGNVWCWGDNERGQLGNGNSGNGVFERYPVALAELSDITEIGAGDRHSLATGTSCPTVWAWGDNARGQLGDGTLTTRTRPVQVDGLGQTGATGGCPVGLTVVPGDGGRVVFAGEQHRADETSGTYRHGDTAELTAIPHPGWRFVRWVGDAAGTETTTTVLMDGAKNCGALFVDENEPPPPEPPGPNAAPSALLADVAVSLGRLDIFYTLEDTDGDLVDIQMEFSADGGATWTTCTPLAVPEHEGTTDLTALPSLHVFVWNTASAGVGPVEVMLRLSPTDQRGAVGSPSTTTVDLSGI